MPIYPGKTKGTWRVVIWAPRQPGEPSRANEKIVEGSKKEAGLFEARFKLELQKNARREYRTAPTLSNFCAETFGPFIRGRVAESTWKKHYHWGLVALCEELGSKRITEITAGDVEDYQTERGGKPATINGHVVLLKQVLNYAKKRHGFDMHELDVRELADPQGRVKAWTVEEVLRLIAAARSISKWQAPMIIFGVNTGCRKGEIVACEWSWIDMAGGMIRIPSNEFWRPKNGKPREVPMSDAIREALTGPLPRRHEKWVFPGRDGVRFGDFPKQPFSRVVKKAGLVGSPHYLRHSFASAFLQKQPDMFLLGKLLGHSTQHVTEIYSHLMPEHLSKARNAVNIGAAPAVVEKAVTNG